MSIAFIRLRPVPAVVLCALAALLSLKAAPAAAASSVDYVLQRGDDLEIRAYNIRELDQVARIRPDGKVTVILLNDVQAAGFTPGQLAATLMEGFSKHFRNPRISVIVRGFSSEHVYVGGEVMHPGEIPIRNSLTALQAVVDAGGLKENTGAEATITVMRTLPGSETQRFTLGIESIIGKKQPDLPLRPGDVVYVPKTFIQVYVGGEVGRPGLVPLAGEMTLTAAIVHAGGLTRSAHSKSVILVRKGSSGAPVVRTLASDAIFDGKPDTVLQPYDIVYVPRSKISKVNQFVDQYIRQMIPVNISGGFSYIVGSSVIP
ncbi:MAG: SLBB domain-containing protein [Acidobacteria bacterium]|nr:SLBB domain-containing protein [Acidobacteriota bacterium]